MHYLLLKGMIRILSCSLQFVEGLRDVDWMTRARFPNARRKVVAAGRPCSEARRRRAKNRAVGSFGEACVSQQVGAA